MMDVMQRIKMPTEILQVVRCLYHNNTHILKLKDWTFPSISTSSGVRQGCPLSPILFVICIDLLLRRIQRDLPHVCARAYADDNAMITPNFIQDGSIILRIYEEFAQVSNLKLNLPKTVLIPLWPCTPSQVKATLIRDSFPEWARTEVALWSIYLRFAAGPGRANHSWDKAIPKYKARVGMWSCEKWAYSTQSRYMNLSHFPLCHIFGGWRMFLSQLLMRKRRLLLN